MRGEPILLEEMCSQKHLYCSECINEDYDNLIATGGKITNRCSECNGLYDTTKLKKLLKPEIKKQLETNDHIIDLFSFPKNLSLMYCTLCPTNQERGWFLIDKADHIQFYTCEMEKCKKTLCLYCNKETTQKELHRSCGDSKYILLDLEKLINYAILNDCPNCPKTKDKTCAYMKDNRCTHITCQNCKKSYCYVCGGFEDTVDKQDKFVAGLSSHNFDWENNHQRCPTTISLFSLKINSWPKDEAKATFEFRNYKISAFINKVVIKYGFEKVKTVVLAHKDKRLYHLPSEFFDKDIYTSKFQNYDFIDKKIFSMYNIN